MRNNVKKIDIKRSDKKQEIESNNIKKREMQKKVKK